MSPAVLLAAAAGTCLAAAIVELAAAGRRPLRRRRPAAAPAPRGLTALLAALGRRVRAPTAPADLDERLAAAGRPLGLGPSDLMALKSGAACTGVLLAGLFAMGLPGRLWVAVLLAAPATGYLLPDLLLHRRTRARAARMTTELADVCDLLRVAADAGLPTTRALAEVGRRHRGLLAAELGAAARCLELGEPADAVLDALARRCPLPGVATLTAALRRAGRHGVSPAQALAALAVEARAQRARALQDAAARAAPKIQLVVALLLVPAVMLLIAALLVQSLAPS